MDPSPAGLPMTAPDDETSGASAGLPGVAVSFGERGHSEMQLSALRADMRSSSDAGHAGPAVSVLADRLAAALVHHEPGWRLPRHSALARRYNVSVAEIEAAIEELVGRHLVRRLADGQLYRASPAEYVIGLEGIPGLLSYVDAMGGDFICRGRQQTWRLPPEDISWALKLSPEQQVCVVRTLWTVGGEPAALCSTYVPGGPDGESDAGEDLPATLHLLQSGGASGGSTNGQEPAGVPSALHIELQAPPPAVARSLRLTAGQPAMMVTVRFDAVSTGTPIALTIAVLRPDMFRVVVESPHPPLPDGEGGNFSGSWTHVVEDWEP